MSKRPIALLVLLVLAFAPLPARAQEEEPASSYVYATYFDCDVTRQGWADQITKKFDAPIYDAAVDDGTIGAWGWMAHHTGGKWRRLQYFTAPTLGALLDAQGTIEGKLAEAGPQGGDAFGEICNSHEDYIWRRVAGTSNDKGRGKAAFSVYMVCDMTREGRADELVKEVFGPVYDRMVAEGKLSSWGWMEHIVGGKYRRLETYTAPDFASLLATRAAIIDEVGSKHEAESDEFSAICSSHQDYMWEIQIEKP